MIVTLSADSTVKIWDTETMEPVTHWHFWRLRIFWHFWQVTRVDIEGLTDLVCMDIQPQLRAIAVGTNMSSWHFTSDIFLCHVILTSLTGSTEITLLIDERTQAGYSIPSKDEHQGVRSLVFLDNILSIGGGMVSYNDRKFWEFSILFWESRRGNSKKSLSKKRLFLKHSEILLGKFVVKIINVLYDMMSYYDRAACRFLTWGRGNISRSVLTLRILPNMSLLVLAGSIKMKPTSIFSENLEFHTQSTHIVIALVRPKFS